MLMRLILGVVIFSVLIRVSVIIGLVFSIILTIEIVSNI